MRPRPGPRSLCLVFTAALAALLWLSSGAPPPLLTVSELGQAEGGMAVRVQGIVVEMREHDSGYVSVTLADLSTGETALASYPPPATELLLREVSIGDEVLVIGVVASESSRPFVYADSRGTTVLSKSVAAVSVQTLCANWRLFEYDRLNVSGVIDVEPESGAAWLTDTLGSARLRVQADTDQVVTTKDDIVTIDGTLLMDTRTMALCLKAWNITPCPA